MVRGEALAPEDQRQTLNLRMMPDVVEHQVEHP